MYHLHVATCCYGNLENLCIHNLLKSSNDALSNSDLGLRYLKKNSWSPELSMKLVLLIHIKIPKILFFFPFNFRVEHTVLPCNEYWKFQKLLAYFWFLQGQIPCSVQLKCFITSESVYDYLGQLFSALNMDMYMVRNVFDDKEIKH